MPGVSMKMSCASPAVAIPRSGARVVCALWETIVTLVPTSALMSVDLPTLGAPMRATKPQRLSSGAPAAGSAIEAFRLDALAGQHGGGGGLLGRALGAAEPFRRRAVGKLDSDAELGIMVGPGPLDLAIGRGGEAARLRPFLKHSLGVPQRPHGRAHARLPQPADQFRGRRVAAVDEHGPDQRLANVGEDGGTVAPARIVLGRPEPDRRA